MPFCFHFYRYPGDPPETKTCVVCNNPVRTVPIPPPEAPKEEVEEDDTRL